MLRGKYVTTFGGKMTQSLDSPSRRQILVSAATSLAGIALTTGCSQQRKPSTFVLVHGAAHGGWCWQRVADRLIAKGHRVFAPTLTGLCERSHLLNDKVDLTTHVNDVVNEIKWKDLDQVVLVGHSYGGMVITGVAEQVGSRLASIVYVDAFLPNDGQSMLDVVNQYAPGWTPPAGPFSGADFAAFMEVNEKDRAWVASKLTEQPPGTATEKLRVSGAFLRVPRKSFIGVMKGEQPFFKAVADRYATDSAWQVHQVDCGHDVMIDKPDELTAILEGAI
jgi:pimeloyl-ACP methyl ester carboxylesterase